MRAHRIGVRGTFLSIVLILAAFSTVAVAQYWAASYGGRVSTPQSVLQARDGTYVIAGSSSPISGGDTDLWVVKLDEYGGLVWQRTYGGPRGEQGNAILQTPDDGFIVAGSTWSFGRGGRDAWMVKIDPDGEIEWERSYGGPEEDVAWSIDATPDGGYVVAGDTRSWGAGARDAWVLKLDAAGNIEWQRSYGGDGDDTARSVCTVEGDGFLFVGSTSSWGAGGYDAWIVRLDAEGTVSWQRTYGGLGNEVAQCVDRTSDGGFVVAAETESFGTESFGAGKTDGWILRLDVAGDIRWQRTYGGEDNESIGPVRQTRDGGFVVAGTTGRAELGWYLWALRLSPQGDVVWQRYVDGTRQCEGFSIQGTADLGFILVGGVVRRNRENRAFWALKLDSHGDFPSPCSPMNASHVVAGSEPVVVACTDTMSFVTLAEGVATGCAIAERPLDLEYHCFTSQ